MIIKPLPEVEFLIPWRQFSKGVRIRPNGMMRDYLVQSGIAKLITEPVKRKRGRPRKKTQ